MVVERETSSDSTNEGTKILLSPWLLPLPKDIKSYIRDSVLMALPGVEVGKIRYNSTAGRTVIYIIKASGDIDINKDKRIGVVLVQGDETFILEKYGLVFSFLYSKWASDLPKNPESYIRRLIKGKLPKVKITEIKFLFVKERTWIYLVRIDGVVDDDIYSCKKSHACPFWSYPMDEDSMAIVRYLSESSPNLFAGHTGGRL